MTAAQAYDALTTDTGFKFTRDQSGPLALQRMLDGLQRIAFPAAMSADVHRLEVAIGVRLRTVTLTTLPPGTDGGRHELDDADARVRADLSLASP